MFVYKAGHLSTRKARTGKKGTSKSQRQTYYFDIEKCKLCPMKEGCKKEGAKSQTHSVTIKSDTHAEREVFKQLATNRCKIEEKNSELNNGHGYDTASTVGLFSMNIHGITTIFAVNFKRILKLLNENNEEIRQK